MARVTTAEVSAILESADYGDLTDLSAFIAMATLLADDCSTAGLSTDKCKEVERWLSAHFVCLMRRQAKSSSVGPISESFDSKIDQGLKATAYGQQAIALDTTDTLRAMSAGGAGSVEMLDPDN